MMRKSKNAPKYPNLAAEMSRENVSISDICKVTGKGKSTIYLYMNGTGACDFTINDAFLISEQLFHGMSISYLFSRSPEAKTATA